MQAKTSNRVATSEILAALLATPIAHRGVHSNLVPENSLAAFDAAARASTPFELDVHLTRDGAVVVFHDDNLNRMTGHEGLIRDETIQSLKKLRLQGSQESVPLLDEVLELVRDRVPMLIEIKGRSRSGALEAAVAKCLDRFGCNCAVQSFNPLSLKWFRDNAPALPRGQLASDFRDVRIPWHQKFLLRRLLLDHLSEPHFLSYDVRCIPNPYEARERRARRIPLVAWTVRSAEELRTARRYADNFIYEGVAI